MMKENIDTVVKETWKKFYNLKVQGSCKASPQHNSYPVLSYFMYHSEGNFDGVVNHSC